MDFLKDNFRELFNACHICIDLMDLIEEEKLEDEEEEVFQLLKSKEKIEDILHDSEVI